MILRQNLTTFSPLDNLLWGMVFTWLIIDSITGCFMSYGINLPLSQFFKSLTLFLIFVRLCRIRVFLITFFFLLVYIAWYFLHLALINKDYALPLLLLSKFLTLLFLYAYFRYCINQFPSETLINTQKALIIASIVIAFNVIIGIMGYGIPTYGESEEDIDMGVKGFFFAGNELGSVMAALVPFIIYLIKTKLKGILVFFAYIAIITIGVLIGTKSAILVTLSSVIIIPMLYMPSKKRLKALLFLIAIICIPSFCIEDLLTELTIGSIERWTYFYDTGGINRLIFSGRDSFWDFKKEIFFNSDFPTLLFGMGAEGKLIERDHLDSLLIFGYCGLFAIGSFFLYLLITAIKHIKYNPLVKVIVFSNLLVIGIGYIAGHVWYSAMASVYIALLNALVFARNKNLFSTSSDNNKI